MNSYYFIIIIVFFNFLFIFLLNKIKNNINIFDKPDGIRKLHKTPVAPLGGFLIFFNILFLFCLSFFDINNLIFDKYFYNQNDARLRVFFSFFVTSTIFFIVGLYDDKNNLSPLAKIIILVFTCACTILIDETMIINSLNFYSTDKIIFLKNFSFIFTILCILFLVNAFNLYDGMNLQSGLYFLLIYFYFFFKDIFPQFSLAFFTANLFFLYLNYKNLIYFGDNGIYINSYIISYIVIKHYNYYNGEVLKADEILLIFLIPTLEVIRLFCSRILNLKNPFLGDRNHIHHLILEKTKSIYLSNFIIFSIVLIPVLFFYFFPPFLIEIIFSSIFIYIVILVYFKYSLNK